MKQNKNMAQTSLLSAVALWGQVREVMDAGQTRGAIADVDAASLPSLDAIKVAPLGPQKFLHGSQSSLPAHFVVVRDVSHAQEVLRLTKTQYPDEI